MATTPLTPSIASLEAQLAALKAEAAPKEAAYEAKKAETETAWLAWRTYAESISALESAIATLKRQ